MAGRRFSFAALALLLLAAPAQASGYPDSGKALVRLSPASDYSDVVRLRPRTLSIMRTRAQGFVPSPELHDYVRSVLMRDLAGIPLPPSFQPDVHILAAPEFTALCTPDGTVMITVGLLEQLETEDELAFVLGHEISHAIYRHHDSDWLARSQYYAVVNAAAVDSVAQQASGVIGAGTANNFARGLDVMRHLYKLSANVLAPQMTRSQEDMADALGFDLMVRAGYDPEAPLAVMDKLGEQEAEAARAAAQAKAAEQNGGGSSVSAVGNSLLGGLNDFAASGFSVSALTDKDRMTDLAINVFDAAVDSMSDEAASHHPAKEREDLLSAYAFREYRDLAPRNPKPLPWSPQSTWAAKPQLTALLSHYGAAEDAAAFVADANVSTPANASAAVARATQPPTSDHAYTEFVAAEYYEGANKLPLSDAALQKAVKGAEPSWEVYARLIDRYVAQNDYAHAEALMQEAVTRFDNSPVLLPKRIAILHGMGRDGDAQGLLPQCQSYDVRELMDECKKAAGQA
ncbi:MAG TPA: M48 family metallopeptidase [Rhizomicrobium sp.]|nr:M48 family metallopeptidase [Rhizomicrobium sp.]